jgi:hypothetical protein
MMKRRMYFKGRNIELLIERDENANVISGKFL